MPRRLCAARPLLLQPRALLRLFALCRELCERTARFFEERERPSIRVVDLTNETLFQLQARKLPNLHSLATQAHGLFGRGA